MKVLSISRTNNMAVGKIAKDIGTIINNQFSIDYHFFWGETNGSFISERERSADVCSTKNNYFSRYIKKIKGTKLFIKYYKELRPDIVHLHNLHGGFFATRKLFRFLANKNVPVIITAHDCWLITGGCPYFIESKCSKWCDGSNCRGCHLNKFFHKAFIIKKHNVAKMNIKAIACCSDYISNVYKRSYLSDKNIITIHNGIDLNVFNNDIKKDDVAVFKKYNIPFVSGYIFAIAADWCHRKGNDYISKLSLDVEGKYNMVVVGRNFSLPLGKSTYYIDLIDNQHELAVLYRNAKLFVNPTREDNYPTTSLESSACGTPVIVFEQGGCGEAIFSDNGFLIKNNYNELLNKTIYIMNNPFNKTKVRNVAITNFDKKCCFKPYINIYEKIIKEFL